MRAIRFFSVSLWAQKASPKTVTLNFEKVKTGTLPAQWKVEATNPRGPLATWQVVPDSTAPSGKKIPGLTGFKQTFGGTFNLCWSDKISFLNGTISVQFKANSGQEDEGGGVV